MLNATAMRELVQRYFDNREFISNEESTKMALVVPFIRLLGYDANSPREVRLEYAAPFVQGDGKKLADRMDYAIFDQTGQKPLMVIEAKPLGTNLNDKSPQLARYIAQVPDLHFGIMTDGCRYQFYGDLEQPNVMDKEPFFQFSLDDDKADWGKVSDFLTKFSRDFFNADTLLTDAEDSRYRQSMIEKLTTTLKAPDKDEVFLKWLTADIYKGKRTSGVMTRMGELAKESIEPTLLRFMTDDFVDKLRKRIQKVASMEQEGAAGAADDASTASDRSKASDDDSEPTSFAAAKIETTDDERTFFGLVQSMCVDAGASADDIIYRDTQNYFNVSFQRKRNWFIRYFDSNRQPSISLPLSVEEATALCPGITFEESPKAFGSSRTYVDRPSDVMRIKAAVLASLKSVQG